MSLLPTGVFPPVFLAAPLLLFAPSPPVALRLPAVERGSTVRRPVDLEIVNRTPDGLKLSIDDQIVLVSTRARSEWTLDPKRWLRGSASKVVVLRISLLRNGQFRLVHEQKVRLGSTPLDTPAP